jgi:hypothetical protein
MASKVPVRYAKIDADGNLCDPLAEMDLKIAFTGPFAAPQIMTVTLRKIGSTVHAQFGVCTAACTVAAQVMTSTTNLPAGWIPHDVSGVITVLVPGTDNNTQIVCAVNLFNNGQIIITPATGASPQTFTTGHTSGSFATCFSYNI